MKKKERGDATATQSRAMSVSARARGQLELSHAHYCRLNGEHSNARTEDPDHDEVAEKFWVSNKFYYLLFFVILSDLNQAVPNHLADAQSNALVGYTTGPSSSARNRLSLSLLLSFSSSSQSYFLSFSIHKKSYISRWLPFCLLGLVPGRGWESRLASS